MTKNKIYSQNFKNIPSAEKLKSHHKKCLEAGNKLRNQIKNSEILALNIVQQKKDLNEFKKRIIVLVDMDKDKERFRE